MASDCVLATRLNCLTLLERAVDQNNAILIEGPVGSGKTSLITNYARDNEKQLVCLQMGEQMDAKSIYGCYHCTEVPGEFVWKPSVITTTALCGGWLLLEDVGVCACELLGALAPLIEQGIISWPGRHEMKVHADFRLFMTCRTQDRSASLEHEKGIYLDKCWTRIRLKALTDGELIQMVCKVQPELSSISRKLLEAFNAVINVEKLKTARNVRNLGSRDFLRWCGRIKSSEINEREIIFQSGVDCLCAFAADLELRKQLMHALAAKINITKEQVEYYAQKHKPALRTANDSVQIGRIGIERKEDLTIQFSSARFSLTRASCVLLERIIACVSVLDPILLVGETGCGKTATVQFIAKHTGHKLHVLNMSEQTDSDNLLGGYKPVTMQTMLAPIRKEYLELFEQSFDMGKNRKFLKHVQNCFKSERWRELLQLLCHTARKVKNPQWRILLEKLIKLERFTKNNSDAMPFAFVEGILLRALREGHWLLLDEINLCTAETLNSLNTLLDSIQKSELLFLQQNDPKPMKIHPDFRLFACMNPATDVAKRNLPTGVRNRFLEIFVDEISDKEDLLVLCRSYLQGLSISSVQLSSIVDFYLDIKNRATNLCSDSWGHSPHYSLRTLCRALTVASLNKFGNQQRSLYEAFLMSFLTELDSKSRDLVQQMVAKYIIGNNSASVKQIVNTPVVEPKGDYCCVEGFWIKKGREVGETDGGYVLTDTVRRHLGDMARVLSAGVYPVLLQGETSVGKTSLIKYVAKLTGNKCVRINNHEHTDLQEYLGSYCSDERGKLRFVEGPLVQAMREGHWIILDELNLAPPDILEALNRLLDDNRELVLPETQEVVKASSGFVVLATQNPAGMYGGRKQLSRAFRNRFIELHFDQLKPNELETILHNTCALPLSYAHKMVNAMMKLQLFRSSSGLFLGKESYCTLRDLFRWAQRYCLAENRDNDWSEYLAHQGYFVLAGRCRRKEDCLIVKETLEKEFKRKIEESIIFGPESPYLTVDLNAAVNGFPHWLWSSNLVRMAVLTGQALRFDEPVLMVGETGCGKTSLCQILTSWSQLSIINCHLMTEAADFLGRLRPNSAQVIASTGALFSWQDGALVVCVREGKPILLDEISLAADSVLERLNSLLEPERLLNVTEPHTQLIEAKMGFKLLATMNPGGDYGKKELSRALRNRFTEIWCCGVYGKEDLEGIVERSLATVDGGKMAKVMVEFVLWFMEKHANRLRITITVRDLLSWVNFVNSVRDTVSIALSYIHGACLVLLDALGTNNNLRQTQTNQIRHDAMQFLCHQIAQFCDQKVNPNDVISLAGHVAVGKDKFGIEPFLIDIGREPSVIPPNYTFDAPTCRNNVLALLRAMQIGKAVLLEGAPGVGKSSLVQAVASMSGHKMTRLNLSDQTDLSDLFGCDLPVIGEYGEQLFAWNDGPLLTAMKEGHWILLDEMNLASQSVLEGLNACLDHRKQVFVPELCLTFKVDHKHTRFFAAQNPFAAGGNRRALPKSFLNRFSSVYIQDLTAEDELQIVKSLCEGKIEENLLEKMVEFNRELHSQVCVQRLWGVSGSPWEFNLRDLIRWMQLMLELKILDPGLIVDVVYGCRMRTKSDKQNLLSQFERIFDRQAQIPNLDVFLSSKFFHIGRCILERRKITEIETRQLDSIHFLRNNVRYLELLMLCVKMNWLALLVGSGGNGKSMLVQSLAALCGRKLVTFHLTSDTDALELLGSFEQVSESFVHVNELKEKLLVVIDSLKHEFDQKRLEKLKQKLQSSFVDSEIIELIEDLRTAQLEDSIKEQLGSLAQDLQQKSDSNVRFEWFDSPFVRAFRDGHWLLLENVNCCSAAVLDRLNGALEPGGLLTLSERGLVNGAIPAFGAHRDFRVFFTMNAKYGGLSRAMRNRALEICVTDEHSWHSNAPDAHDALMNNNLNEKQRATIYEAFKAAASRGRVTPYLLMESAFNLGAFGDLEMSQLLILMQDIFGQKFETHELIAQNEFLNTVTSPSIGQLLSKPIETIAKYKTMIWKNIAKESDDKFSLSAIKFNIFSAGVKDLKKRAHWMIDSVPSKLHDEFNRLVTDFGKILRKDAHGSLLWDPRFSDRFLTDFLSSKNPPEESVLNGLVFNLCLRWLLLTNKCLAVKKNSALALSKQTIAKKMDPDSLPSVALQHLWPLVCEIETLAEHWDWRIDNDKIENLLASLSALDLFINLSKRSLSTQLVLVQLRLCWQQVETSLLDFMLNNQNCNLSSLCASIHSHWSLSPADLDLFMSVLSALPSSDPFNAETLHLAGVWPFLKTLNSVELSLDSLDENTIEIRRNLMNQLSEGSFCAAELAAPTATQQQIPLVALRHTKDMLGLVAQWKWIENGCDQLQTFILSNQTVMPHVLVWKRTVPWTRFRDKFLRLMLLNSDDLKFDSAGMKTKNIHLCQRPSVTHLLTSLLEPIGFELSLAHSQVTIDQLKQFITQCQSIAAAMWRHSLIIVGFSKQIKTELMQLVSELVQSVLSIDELLFNCCKETRDELLVMHQSLSSVTDISSTDFAHLCLKLGVALCKLATPQPQMLDPVLKIQAEKMLCEHKLAQVESEISLLNKFSESMSGQKMNLESHVHPYLRMLAKQHKSLTQQLAQLQQHNCGERPPNTSFSRLAMELSTFLSLTQSSLTLNPTHFPQTLATLQAWLMSCEQFKENMRDQFFGFPDIIVPFLTALLTAQCGANLMSAACLRKMRQTEISLQIDGKQLSQLTAACVQNPKYTILPDGCVTWLLSQSSSAPIRLQFKLVQWLITNNQLSGTVCDWLLRIWEHVIPNDLSDELYRYKERAEELTDTEREELEFGIRYPDFSSEEHVEQGSDDAKLSREDMAALLKSLVSAGTSTPDSQLYPLGIWLAKLQQGTLTDNFDSKTMESHLLALGQLTNQSDIADTTDVYRSCSLADVEKCSMMIGRLITAVEQLERDWPEVTSLANILSKAKQILTLNVQTPLLKLAVRLEELLAECSQWQTVASKAVSLESHLEEIKSLLIEWRKRQLLCWQKALEQVQSQCREDTLLAALPMVKATVMIQAKPEEEANYLSTMMEWLLNSSLMDFPARLQSVSLCERFLPSENTNTLRKQLGSLRLYFQQYIDVVKKECSKVTAPVEKQLEDFVKVFKFQDLSLWSVKMSAQRAHQQLFKLVKKYREAGSSSAGCLFSELQPTPSLSQPVAQLSPLNDKITDVPYALYRFLDYNSRLCQFGVEVQTELNTDSSCLPSLTQLTEFSNRVSIELCSSVQYSGTDEEKEKMQGRTLQSRQKALSALLAEFKHSGLSLRRALRLDEEQLTNELLFNPTTDQSAASPMPQCTSYRSVLLSSLKKPHSQVQPANVNTVRCFGNLLPSVLKAKWNQCQMRAGAVHLFKSTLQLLDAASDDLHNSISMEFIAQQKCIQHEITDIQTALESCSEQLTQCLTLWKCCPSEEQLNQWELDSFTDQLPALAAAHNQEARYLNNFTLLQQLSSLTSDMLKPVSTATQDQDNNWKYTSWSHVTDILDQLEKLKDVNRGIDDLIGYSSCDNREKTAFNRGLTQAQMEVDKALCAMEKLRKTAHGYKRPKLAQNSEELTQATEELLTHLLLIMQRVKKLTDADQTGVIDAFDRLLTGIDTKMMDELSTKFAAFWTLLCGCSDQKLCSSHLSTVCVLAGNVFACVDFVHQYTCNSLMQLSQLYLQTVSLFVKLLTKGLVDPIPQMQQGENDDTPSKFEDISQAGLGDGEGAKDVGDEIDDLGQLDETQKKQEEQQGEDNKMEDMDKPIEMEDDFDANLEEMKLDKDDGDSGSESDEGEEPNPDWQMGKNEEEQEEQLDPKLWEQEAEKAPEQSDANEGAEKSVDELVAADEDEKEGKDEEQTGNEENENEEEGEELDMENIDLNDEDAKSGDEEETQDNGEEGMEVEEVEKVEETQSQDNEEKPEEGDERTDDVSAHTMSSASQFGIGDAGDTTEKQNEQNNENMEKQEESNEGKDENEQLKSQSEGAAPNAAASDHISSETDANNEQKEEQKKRPELMEKKTLADNLEMKTARKAIERNESARDENGGQEKDSGLYSHAAELDANSMLSRDAATLEEARRQGKDTVEMESNETEEAANEREPEVDPKEKEGGESKGLSDQIVPMEEQAEEDGNETSMDIAGKKQNRHTESTIHTVMDFYERASHAVSLQGSYLPVDQSVPSCESTESSSHLWQQLSALTEPLAAELTENLRLILEPTQASKMEGDYRTGKRLNVRKLIAYVASNFRKNRIWLRRTRKAKRQYQIMLALDDSSSMDDNQTKQLTFESVCLLESALRHLEVGQLGVCKFGQDVQLLHSLQDQFSQQTGGQIFTQLSFQQSMTDICKLLDFSVDYFSSNAIRSSGDVPAQLLLIISDGRGLFAKGMDKVQRAVQTAISAGVFLMFIIVDNPNHKDSIVDIKLPVFNPGGVEIHSYMEYFPFPFYVILRNTNALPALVGDALRQWFQCIANN